MLISRAFARLRIKRSDVTFPPRHATPPRRPFENEAVVAVTDGTHVGAAPGPADRASPPPAYGTSPETDPRGFSLRATGTVRGAANYIHFCCFIHATSSPAICNIRICLCSTSGCSCFVFSVKVAEPSLR